jgi:hypothetical protein
LLRCGVRPMTASGQTRSFGDVGSMSGLPESGQSIRVLAMSHKCHLLPDAPQQTASLLDYLIGARRQTRWHLDAERLGGLEIDHELELGQLLDWQIGGLISFENAASIDTD